MSESEKKAFDQGHQAYHIGLSESDNPYHKDSKEAAAWAKGFQKDKK